MTVIQEDINTETKGDAILVIKIKGAADISPISDLMLRDDVKYMMFFADDSLRNVQNEKAQQHQLAFMSQILDL